MALAGPNRRRSRSRSARAGEADPPAVVLGGGVTALSAARSLADAGVEVHVLDRPDSPARASRLCRTFVDVGCEGIQPRMLEWLAAGPAGAVVLAGSDEGVELIARNRAELVALGYRPIEANAEVLLAMLDKDRTYELAREHGIPVPRTLPLRDQRDLAAIDAEFAYPLVLKPVSSHVFASRMQSGAKVITVGSRAELQATFERMAAAGVELLATEVISGPDDEYVSYYSYIDEHGEPLLSFTKCKLRQYPNRFGIGTYHATTHDPQVAQAGLRFFQAVELRGIGNVEFKRDQRDGRLKLIECNARLTMSNELIRRAGVDLALFAYARVLGRPTPPVDRYAEGMRLWSPTRDTRAFLEYRRSGALSLAQWLGSLMHPQHFPVARLDDPMPALLGAANLARIARARGGAVVGPRVWGAGMAAASDRLARAGRRGYPLAARLDLVGAIGPGYVWRRVRAERRLAGLGEQARNAAYERIWREAAERVHASFAELAPGLFECRRDGAVARVYQQLVALDDPVTLRVALDKALVHRLLGQVGVRIPEHLEFDAADPGPALEFLARAGGSCVVKPAAGTGGGSGTTTDIAAPEELLRARLHAGAGRLLIERQVEGAVYRLLLLDGELLDVVRSVPGHLVGDGRASVEQLIARENERRLRAAGAAKLSPLGVNLDMVIALERAGLTLSSVPAAGRRVRLGTVTNNNLVEDNETFHGELAQEILTQARTAQRAVGLRLAGVDVITPDPSLPLAQAGGVINEVNGTPGLHHHYLVADPRRATPVAVPVLERVLAEAERRDGPAPDPRLLGADVAGGFSA